MAIFFFCGVGGIGMSSIALYLKSQGNRVLGSDRSFDLGLNGKMKTDLEKAGIELYPQDGSGVSADINQFVVSTAVEESIPDVRQAVALGLLIKKRAAVLADILAAHRSVAVGGTSGKTTTTAMVGHILATLGKNPTMINGGISINTYNGQSCSNLIVGHSDLCVAEADESDGSIELYTPFVAIVTNISLDHKPLAEIRPLFERFFNRATGGAVVNADCDETAQLNLTQKKIISFSVTGRKADVQAQEIQVESNGMRFLLNGEPAFLPMLGVHNIENALAAIAACRLLGIEPIEAAKALESFLGTKRRLQILGTRGGVTVIDDYAHNPEKIKAVFETMKLSAGRVFMIFQPHGFAPTRLMKDGFIEVFQHYVSDTFPLIMPEIYYVGGTVAKDISSNDIISAVAAAGKPARFFEKRADIVPYLANLLQAGDRVVVMGARDDTLSAFGLDILQTVKE